MANTSGRHSEEHGSKQTSRTLTALPTELLEEICSQPTKENEDYAAAMVSSLRLTCKTMHVKLQDFFYKAAFGSITVKNLPSSLNRLLEISRMPAIAPKVTKVKFMDQEWRDVYEYNDVEYELGGTEMAEDARLRVEEKMKVIDEDYSPRRFIGNTGLDALILIQAISSLPNLRDFDIMPSHGWYTSHPKTADFFATLLASWHAAGVKPQRLAVRRGKMNWRDDFGVNVEALAAPSSVLDCLADLRNLDLLVMHYRHPLCEEREIAQSRV